MANIRIVSNNAANRASVSASNTSGSLVASNMLTESKSEIHRSTGTSVTYTLTWASSETIGCIALPCTNLSSTATVTVTLKDSGGATIVTSGSVTAVPGYNLDTTGVTFNVNQFAYGLFSKVAVWFTSQPTNVRSCTIAIVDTSNSSGFIECSKIVAGPYWEPEFNIQNGVQFTITDGSTVSRTNAGESVADRGFIYEKISFNFSLLPEADKSDLVKILKNVGTYKNFLVSLFPDHSVAEIIQESLVYGKRSNAPISYRLFGYYDNAMEVLSW